MRYKFVLHQVPMVSADGPDVPRPRVAAEFGCPQGDGWVQHAWVTTSGAGGAVLNVLWADLLDDGSAGVED
jgi:hypothetical protein